jgi:predicted ATPase
MDHVAALYNPEQHHSYALFYGVDIGATSRQCRALALWCLGYPDQALEEVRDSFALVQKLSHPFTTAVTLDWAAMLHQLRGERQLTQERAEAAISLSTEQELPLYLGAGIILRGWALATQGEEELGISEIRRGLEVWHTTGTRNTQTHFLALLAEAYGIAGQAGAGLEALAEALDFVGRTGECFYEAELYRLKGVLLLAQEGKNQKAKGKGQKSKIPNPEHPTSSTQVEAEACFLRAIEVARQQQAKSWELRATMSLARLWQSQGKTAEARQMLAEIYGWFTEGFDTKDLQEAKALIEELSH